MILEPFRMADLDALAFEEAPANPARTRHLACVRHIQQAPGDYREWMETPWSWTAWHPAGVALACAGIIPGANMAWGLLSADMRRYMVPVSRAVSRVLSDHARQVGPVNVEIDNSYPPAVRWAMLLGFRHVNSWTWVFNDPPV